MKAKHILAVFCGMLLFEAFLSAQTEEFRFKLYLESLSSGKKDTLELGVGPNGYGVHDCRYDSTLCSVYTSPFFDTVEHIGAFLVPGVEEVREEIQERPLFQDIFRVECPIYAKKRISILRSDLVVVFPAKEQPVKVSWDKQQFQNPIVKRPILTNMDEGYRFDFLIRPFIYRLMSKEDECLINYSFSSSPNSDLYTYITDSTGAEHPYIHFYVLLGWTWGLEWDDPDWWLAIENSNQQASVSVFPNPIHDQFKISSDMELKAWRVYSVAGKLILSGRGIDTEIDCQNWVSGIYVFCWEGKNHETGFLKIIKR